MSYFEAYLFLILIWVISTILIKAFFKSTRARSNLPPSPFSLPIIGHLHLLFQSLIKLSTDSPYDMGPFFSFLWALNLMFAPYGSYWKFMKKFVMSQLLNGLAIDLLHQDRHHEINRYIKSLYEKANVGTAVNLNVELVKDNIRVFKRLDLQGFRKRVKDIHRRYDALIERIIKEHEDARKQGTQSQGKDLLNILLDIVEDESMEIEKTSKPSFWPVKNIFVAATDNSAIAKERAISELINHPNIMKKAVEEIDHVVGKKKLLLESDIPNLLYLQAIFKEMLHLHPSLPFINMWALSSYWESPLEFRPERFQKKQLDVRGQHFEFLPFGSGRRMCPGTSLDLKMVHATLGAMIQCFEWKAGEDGNLTSVDMNEGIGFNLPRANPLVCVPVARLEPILLSEKANVGTAVNLNVELVKVTNNLITRIILGHRCSENAGEADHIRKLIFKITEVIGAFNLSDNIHVFKRLDLQGFGKRVKDIHRRYDALVERIVKEHEDARKQGTQSQRKDLLNILLDIAEDESMEINLIIENIKAFIMVT
ncbi:hypothetical protein L1987_46270 [Smallanthus sonchifolius]|uniref:Uncharacterized protein n=1 Tax=Smallanthus sonchifolius TaxID=185202 RepID=A0ACB9G092_9ASTR|nr:hypothetical protein L1987_46270 [Smallanthus sonchifolius]